LNRNLTVIAALILALVALGGNFFVLYQNSSQNDQNKAAFNSQVAALQSSVTGLESNVNSLQAQLSKSQTTSASQEQQIAAAQTSILGLQTQLATLIVDLNSNITNALAFQDMALVQLEGFNSTLTALAQRLDSIAPSVPLSTLEVVSEAYNTTSATFSIVVQNNLDVTVYAQIYAILYGQVTTVTSADGCDGTAGTYTSQLYQFPANSTTSTQLPLSQGIYDGCGISPLSSVWLDFEASQSVQVSHVYTFDVVPPYTFSGGGNLSSVGD
jgi:hypothetical protein